MRRSALVAMSVGCILLNAPAQGKAADEAAPASKLEALEREGLEAAKKPDAEAFSKLTADDFIGVFRDGSRGTKADLVRALATSHIGDYSMKDVQTVMLGKNAGIVLYRLSYSAVENGNTGPRRIVQASSVWVNRDGRWLNVFFQETPLLK